jgi:farnesyl diphosphate synthase
MPISTSPPTCRCWGLERSGAYAQELLGQALQALEQSGLPNTQALQGLANMVVNRIS